MRALVPLLALFLLSVHSGLAADLSPKLKNQLEKGLLQGYIIFSLRGEDFYLLRGDKFLLTEGDLFHGEFSQIKGRTSSSSPFERILQSIRKALGRGFPIYLRKNAKFYQIEKQGQNFELQVYPMPGGEEERIVASTAKKMSWEKSRVQLALLRTDVNSSSQLGLHLAYHPVLFWGKSWGGLLHLGGHILEGRDSNIGVLESSLGLSYFGESYFLSGDLGIQYWTKLSETNGKGGVALGWRLPEQEKFLDQIFISFHNIYRSQGNAGEWKAGVGFLF